MRLACGIIVADGKEPAEVRAALHGTSDFGGALPDLLREVAICIEVRCEHIWNGVAIQAHALESLGFRRIPEVHDGVFDRCSVVSSRSGPASRSNVLAVVRSRT